MSDNRVRIYLTNFPFFSVCTREGLDFPSLEYFAKHLVLLTKSLLFKTYINFPSVNRLDNNDCVCDILFVFEKNLKILITDKQLDR